MEALASTVTESSRSHAHRGIAALDLEDARLSTLLNASAFWFGATLATSRWRNLATFRWLVRVNQHILIVGETIVPGS